MRYMDVALMAPERYTEVAPRTLDKKRLEDLARARGAHTPAEIADLLAMHRVNLWRLIEGHNLPRLEIALDIAEALGTTVEQLFPRKATA